MATVQFEKIPVLTGQAAKKFVKTARNPEPLRITEQQRKIFAALKPKQGNR